MAYKPADFGPNLRDETYVDEIAAKRPMLASRFQCSEPPEPAESLRGNASDDACATFNERLRSGR